jgi:hypothetical protein
MRTIFIAAIILTGFVGVGLIVSIIPWAAARISDNLASNASHFLYQNELNISTLILNHIRMDGCRLFSPEF